MGIDSEEILDANGDELPNAYDETASDALYQDHPRAAPAGSVPVDPGDDEPVMSFDEDRMPPTADLGGQAKSPQVTVSDGQ